MARPILTRPVPGGERLSALEDVDPLLARLFAARGVRAARELDYSLTNLAPVGSLDNIADAVELLLRHADRKIVVIGDFDADGATSSALVLRCLGEFGFAAVDFLVPNRFDYGYGLSPEIVGVASRLDPTLIVTVDNGISSHTGVAAAKAAGIDVLVTDHHLPPEELPAADVIVNPNLPDSKFPSRNLAGVGVAFYVMAALGRELERRGRAGAARVPATYLDLVALGTVADVVPLDYNNRILVEQGLRRIRAGKTVPGISALLEQAGRDRRRAVSQDLGFAVAPRLNAAGRLEDMSVGIECLATDDMARATALAASLDQINRERREIETNMREQAFAALDAIGSDGLPRCVCVYDPEWHQGVVGLIAARVKERCHRPAIAFAREAEGRLKGSVRSVSGVHARDLLESISSKRPGLVEKFGGHAMAAGLTIAEANYEEFAETAAHQLKRLYPDADFSGAILTDGTLPADALGLEFARTLREAGPWGSGFPEPVWQGDFHILEQRTVGEVHLKMRVRPLSGSRPVDAIAFNQASDVPRGTIRCAYRLDVNAYRGVENPQLIVEQLVPLGGSHR